MAVNFHNNNDMDWTFPFKHWLATLVLGPLLPLIYALIFIPEKGQFEGWLEMYPLSFAFSLFFSLPTLIFYYGIFYFLSTKKVAPVMAKIILIISTIIGITTTILIIGGSLSGVLIFSYFIASIISAFLFRLYRKEKLTEPNLSSEN